MVSTFASADWNGSLEGGAVVRDDGNATQLRLKLSNNQRPLTHSLYVDWIRAADGDNSYVAGYIPRFWLGDRLYLFADLKYRVDKPLTIDNETKAILGIGNQFIANEAQSLWVELGVGQRQTEFTSGTENDDVFGLLRGGFTQSLSDVLRFEIDADALQSDSLTESTIETGISFKMPAGTVKVSYRTRRIELNGQDAVTDSDTFVSFYYGI